MTDITELAQLRGRTVDYPYYLVECDCGKIYPSSELSGGEPMGDSGDYSDCYCPHCGEGEEHFAECADPETAWKAQQDKIDALVEALEKAQQRITQMESRTVTDWIEHDGKWRPESLGLDELVNLKTRKQELKIPYPAGKVKGWMNTGGDMDVMAYKLASPQASTVTVKLPPKIERDYVDGWFSHKGGLVGGRAAEWYNKALDDVIAELAAQGIKVEAE
ncbi:TPA: hypothetical protein ACX48A_004938 [Klebsiella pneumoniae]